ncbi:hypothetical protein DV737_g3498, partial [Chaetothyriales sp. CBS 132003]
MLLCCSSDDKEPADEYDPLPFWTSWKLKSTAKREIDPNTGDEVLRLGSNRLFKTHCLNTEYQALKLVDRQTSVPTYKVVTVYNRPEGKLVEYEALQGKPLDEVWPSMPVHQRSKVIADLGRFVEQLRKMQPPKHFVVGDATLGGAVNQRFGHNKVGPFYTLDAFHEFERRGHAVQDFSQQEVKATHTPTKPYQLKFTHGNLCPRNILVDASGRIIALIGWENSGWFPEYWEYTQMCHNCPKTMSDWLDAMVEVVPRYDQEMACEEFLRLRFSASTYDLPLSVRAPSPNPSQLERERQEINDKNTESTSG